MPVSAARAAAFDILLRVERESSYAADLLHSAVYERLSTADHALATELVMGVLRWRSRLDDAISANSSHTLAKLDLEILIALRLGLYQFLWLDRIPRRAALHESVELVKRARKRSAAPFVNAVLRKLADTSPLPGADAHANVRASDSGTIARTFAHPRWLVERWAREYGLPATLQICQYDQSIPETAVRLRRPGAEQNLHQEGVSLLPGRFLATARHLQQGDIAKTQAFRNGAIVIQDEGSQLVAALVNSAALTPGSRVLDCCAAPGGKTLALADQNPETTITAIELHLHRVRLLKRLLHTAGSQAAQIRIVAADSRHLPFSRPFERVLADVPCSGTGTLARNPEIKWRLAIEDLSELHDRQVAILRSAMKLVSRGGRMIYSTCSLEKEENENVLEQALSQDDSFHLLPCQRELDHLKDSGELVWTGAASLTRGPYLRTLPGVHPCDGFFAAILEKK